MKKMFKAFAILAAVAMLGSSFVSCSTDDDGGEKEIAAETLKISKSRATVAVDGSMVLVATTNPSNATVKWSSNDNSVVKVNSKGVITGIKDGKATITAKSGSKSVTCDVTVVTVTSLELAASSGTCSDDGVVGIKTVILPATAVSAGVGVEYTSENPAVATVDTNGIVFGVSAGTTKITVKVGTLTKTFDVTVTASSAAGGSYSALATERKSKGVITAKTGTEKVTMNGTEYSSLEAAFEVIRDSGTYNITLTSGIYEVTHLNLNKDTLKLSNFNPTVVIKGADAEYGLKTVIKGTGKMKADGSFNNSEKARELLEFYTDGGNLVLENLTLINTYQSSTDCQAEALGYDANGYCVAVNCSFLSHQDTMRTTGKAWFYKCYVEGDVDFIWMEQAGKVALYEDCVIRAVTDRTKDVYIGAPRAQKVNNIYKGLVLYKSALEFESDANGYLARNPWASSALLSYYNNVNIIGCELFGSINEVMWKGACNTQMMGNCPYAGFNTDSYFAKSALGRRLSDTYIASEFAGRENIFNRYYDKKNNVMVKDATAYFDINGLITTNGWTAPADTSVSD